MIESEIREGTLTKISKDGTKETKKIKVSCGTCKITDEIWKNSTPILGGVSGIYKEK